MLVPAKIERKAAMPECKMRVVPEEEHHTGVYGPSNRDEVKDADIGQQLKIEWTLEPATDAYGFLIKNCTVKDEISGEEHLVIDDRGWATDI